MGWGEGGAVYGYFFLVKEYTVALITLMNERLGNCWRGGGVLLLFVALGDNFSHVSSL